MHYLASWQHDACTNVCCPAHRCEQLELLSISSTDLCVASAMSRLLSRMPWRWPVKPATGLHGVSIIYTNMPLSNQCLLWLYLQMTARLWLQTVVSYLVASMLAIQWHLMQKKDDSCACTAQAAQVNVVYLCSVQAHKQAQQQTGTKWYPQMSLQYWLESLHD